VVVLRKWGEDREKTYEIKRKKKSDFNLFF